MSDGLGAYIRSRREGRLTQAELADAANVSKSHLSQIELGKIGLPGPQVRRELAKALGVTHLDILIAAGEIRPDEIEEADKQGVTTLDPEVQEIISEIAATQWSDESIDFIKMVLKQIARG